MAVKKSSTPATWTEPDDAPELTEAFFQAADRYDGATLKPRGCPKAQSTKETVKLRLDTDVLAALRASLALAGKLA